jgi:Domain of unknown function (DUF5076)
MFGRSKGQIAGAIDVAGVPGLGGAQEFLRMWNGGEQGGFCFVSPQAIDPDPFVFGIRLVDAIKHGAKAYAGAVDISEEDAYKRILEGFHAELENPTDEPKQLN